MTRSLLTNALVIGSLAAAHVAAADPKHVLVLKPEGNADAGTKAKVDAQIVKLAKNLEGNVEAGEITFADAAAAVGCSGGEAQCRDDVLSTMGVDEVVSITVTSLPSGDLRVVVHRVPKGAPIKDAQTTVPTGQAPDAKIASDIGPVFGVKAAKPAGGAATAGTTAGAATGGAAAGGATTGATTGGTSTSAAKPGGATASGTTGTTTTTSSGAWSGPNPGGTTTTSSGGAWSGPNTATPASGSTSSSAAASSASATPTHTATPTRTAQAEPGNTVTAAPNGQVSQPAEGHSSTRAVTGLAVGGGLIVLSVIMWAEASSTQSDINSAPTRSPADFQRLQDLESKGDTFAGLGNLFFIGGVVVGGISGYYFWKSHRSGSSTQARLAPTMFDHGAGLALTVGGAP